MEDEQLDDSKTKRTLSLRVSPQTRRRAELWIKKYGNVLGRSEVLRAIFVMGLDAADRRGLQLIAGEELKLVSRRPIKIAPPEPEE